MWSTRQICLFQVRQIILQSRAINNQRIFWNPTFDNCFTMWELPLLLCNAIHDLNSWHNLRDGSITKTTEQKALNKGGAWSCTWRENGEEIRNVQSSDGVITSTGHFVLSQYSFVILEIAMNNTKIPEFRTQDPCLKIYQIQSTRSSPLLKMPNSEHKILAFDPTPIYIITWESCDT